MFLIVAYLLVIGTLMIGFGSTMLLSASIDNKPLTISGGVVVTGAVLVLISIIMQPFPPAARLPLAFIEVYSHLAN